MHIGERLLIGRGTRLNKKYVISEAGGAKGRVLFDHVIEEKDGILERRNGGK